MFETKLMIRAHNRSFKERPNTFDAVGMHVTAHPFINRVIHGFMSSVLILNALVGVALIGIDRLCFVCGRFPNKLLQLSLSRAALVVNYFQANPAAPLQRASNNDLVSFVACALPVDF